MFPFTRVPFWVRILDPQPSVGVYMQPANNGFLNSQHVINGSLRSSSWSSWDGSWNLGHDGLGILAGGHGFVGVLLFSLKSVEQVQEVW